MGNDSKHKVDYIDTASVVSGSVSNDPDCRPCDLKKSLMTRSMHHQLLYLLLAIKPHLVLRVVRVAETAKGLFVHARHINKMLMVQLYARLI